MCGIFGVFSNENNTSNLVELLNGMKMLQHRGKDGYGISGLTYNRNIYTIKNEGEIKNIETNNIYFSSCIGHVRYSTSGESIKTSILKHNELQPITGYSKDINKYTLIHNGNIPNIDGHDTSFINEIISSNYFLDIKTKLISIINNIPGAYSIIILTNKGMYIMRDRFGIRPLCIGKKNNNYYVSSENIAFNNGIEFIRDVNPGELININNNGLFTLYQHSKPKKSLCSFEILYFLNENSIVDNINIKNIRQDLGKQLAFKDKKQFMNGEYIVVGIPETGILYGKSYAKELNLNYKQVITKNKNVSRTFIVLNNEDRIKLCNDKFIYNTNDIYGKKIIIVDDTIVRGNVIKSIICNLKKCGAKEIHIRIPSPPVIDICELGISIQSKNELLFNNKTLVDVLKELNVNSIMYLNISELYNFPKNSYNQCFSGYIDPEIKSFNPYLKFI